jgi:hypothetical protein
MEINLIQVLFENGFKDNFLPDGMKKGVPEGKVRTSSNSISINRVMVLLVVSTDFRLPHPQ